MLNIVGIGGGTGLPVLLKGLSVERDVAVTAVVTVADNGGSSGRLREICQMPAVGDLRNCLVALSRQGCLLADLFQHRFSVAAELQGHALGNLIVAALYQRTGSLSQALSFAEALLPLQGRALASTDVGVTLCAMLENGAIVRGESQISDAQGRIMRLWIEPSDPPAAPGVLDAIRTADAIVFAPGSLYTSVMPNLLVAGVIDAIRSSHATKIHVCNLVTQPGETDGFTAATHLRVLVNLLGPGVIDFSLVNTGTTTLSARQLERACEAVRCDSATIRSLGVVAVEEDFVDRGVLDIRHDSDVLRESIMSIARAGVAARTCVPATNHEVSQEGSYQYA